jgi:hypothetical protein
LLDEVTGSSDDSFLKPHLGFVTQGTFRAGDVCQRLPYITRSCRSVKSLEFPFKKPLEQVHELKEAERLSLRHIKYPSDTMLTSGREQIGVYDIVYVCKVARLQAVAMNFEWFLSYRASNKARYDRCVFGIWVLPGTKDNEEPRCKQRGIKRPL